MRTDIQNKNLIAAIALFIIPLSGLTIDIYIPSLPEVSQYFSVDKSLAQLTISAYMLGIGVMQLFAGGISDSFGRKKPYVFSMIVFILATILIPFSTNIYILLLLRLFEGCAIGITIVPVRSVFADLFEGKQLHAWANYMTMAWSCGPIIAPAIGGYLQFYFGWQACFYFLALYSAIMFILTLLYVPETSQHYHAFKLSEIFTRYKNIFFHREFLCGIFIDGALYSMIIIFNIAAPFLIQSVLNYSAVEFGHIALLMGLAWFLGTMTNRFLLNFSIEHKTVACLVIMLTATIAMIIVNYFLPLSLMIILIPSLVLFWVGGIIFPNYFARNMSLFPKTSGSANALFGASVFCISGISSALGSMLKANNGLPLAFANVVLILFCIIVFFYDVCSRKKNTV